MRELPAAMSPWLYLAVSGSALALASVVVVVVLLVWSRRAARNYWEA